MELHKIWIEQRKAAFGIEDEFGTQEPHGLDEDFT